MRGKIKLVACLGLFPTVRFQKCPKTGFIFTCELIQAAALAATMQGHAGLGPAKPLPRGRRRLPGMWDRLRNQNSLVVLKKRFRWQLTARLWAQLRPAYTSWDQSKPTLLGKTPTWHVALPLCFTWPRIQSSLSVFWARQVFSVSF